jgi:small GTP-binding protein
METYDNTLAVSFLGDSGVGKSCLLDILVNKLKFMERHIVTIGCNFYHKNVCIDNKNIRLILRDLSGNDEYNKRLHILVDENIRNSDAIVLVFSLTSKESFDSLTTRWINSMQDKVCCLLIGTKCDENNKTISNEEIMNFAQKYNVEYVETSSNNNINLDAICLKICKKIANTKRSFVVNPFFFY